jgi:hypothetical protein
MTEVTDPVLLSQLNAGLGGGGMEGESQFPGVDASKSGEDYLKQFPAEIQQGVRNYVHGLSMPTGNPRKENIVKIVANKYGADIGMPADDSTFKQRQNLRSQLTSGSASSMGGQLRNGTTAMEHLADTAESAVNLHNYSGLGIAPLAHVINKLRGGTTDQQAAVKALEDAAGHYGQEITKFYAGSAGAEGERERFINSLGGTLSPAELSSVLQTELNLIPAKMDQIREEIGTTLGPGNIDQEMQQKVARQDAARQRIQAAIGQLRGTPMSPGSQGAPMAGQGGPVPQGPPQGAAMPQNAPAPAAMAPGGIREGQTATNRQTGQRIIFRNGAWGPM